MRTIADERTLYARIERLRRLRPDTAAAWGTRSAGEMLCHLGDARESVLRVRFSPCLHHLESGVRSASGWSSHHCE